MILVFRFDKYLLQNNYKAYSILNLFR